MANKIRTEGLLQSQVYENGNLYSISIADLKGNEIAITQLVNDYNTKVQTIEKLQQSEKRLASELQYQNASPFFAIIAALISIVGSVISCCGVNFITSNEKVMVGYILVASGSLLLFIGSALTICFKYVYRWMNKQKNKNDGYR